jgi:hypothetical protein
MMKKMVTKKIILKTMNVIKKKHKKKKMENPAEGSQELRVKHYWTKKE